MMKMAKQELMSQEDDHEVFLGYESGAIGLFKLWVSKEDYRTPSIEHKVLISP